LSCADIVPYFVNHLSARPRSILQLGINRGEDRKVLPFFQNLH
jgi:hypothetical protein